MATLVWLECEHEEKIKWHTSKNKYVPVSTAHWDSHGCDKPRYIIKDGEKEEL